MKRKMPNKANIIQLEIKQRQKVHSQNIKKIMNNNRKLKKTFLLIGRNIIVLIIRLEAINLNYSNVQH